jgi:hypothetical protein
MNQLLEILRIAKLQYQEELDCFKNSKKQIHYFKTLIKTSKLMKGKIGRYLRANPNPSTVAHYEGLQSIYSQFICEFKEEIRDYQETYPEPSRLEIDNAERQIALFEQQNPFWANSPYESSSFALPDTLSLILLLFFTGLSIYFLCYVALKVYNFVKHYK